MASIVPRLICGRCINYAYSCGDSILDNNTLNNPRGMFGKFSKIKMASASDGTSNTIMLSEATICQLLYGWGVGNESIHGGIVNLTAMIATNPALCMATKGPKNNMLGSSFSAARQNAWTCGSPSVQGFTTVLPPNAPRCAGGAGGIWTPDSYHPGGVNASLADGSVQFISSTIDTGNLSLPEVASGRSPYGVWGALGSKDGGESSSSQF